MMKASLAGKKIIIVLPGSELGGAERQGLHLARHLKDEQHCVVTVFGLCAQKRGRVTDLCEEYGIAWRGAQFHWPDWQVARFKELAQFALRLRREKPDILLPYTWLPNVACGMVWKSIGASLCVWNQRDAGLFLNTEFWHKTAVRRSACHVSNCETGKAFLMHSYGLQDRQITVIRNAMVMQHPRLSEETWRQQIGVSESALLVCMVANLHWQKDHVTLLKAWQVVIKREPAGRPSPVLCLAGRFDGAEVELAAVVRDLGLASTVRFLGAVDDISGLLAVADICVHSSKTEGAPNAIIEAMASRLPVVATDVPGIREVLGPAGDALVPVGDHEALADRISHLMNSPETRRTWGDENYQRAKVLFDPEENMHAYSSLLKHKLSVLEGLICQ